MAGLATEDSIVNSDKMFESNGINLFIGSAESVDTNTRKVKLSDGSEIPYHKLILGMGSKPFIPPIENVGLEGVFTIRSLKDAENIKRFIQSRSPKKMVFIGAGFISLEVASLLLSSNPNHYDLSIIESLDYPLPLMLDNDMASKVHEYLDDKGLKLRMSEKVTRILGNNGVVSGVELSSGEKLDADIIFLNVGALPNLKLATDMGLEMGKYGIKVNEFLETSNPDILAAGDCIENHHFITRKPVSIQLRGPAVIQGRLMAKRLAGFDIPFTGLLGNSAVKLFDKYIGVTGLTDKQAREEGFDTVCSIVDSRNKHAMLSNVKSWTIKMVFDRQSQKLLGGQILSDDVAPVKEIDTVNALILGEKTIPELAILMCAGNPDCSSEPSAEPISIAAEQALQKLRK